MTVMKKNKKSEDKLIIECPNCQARMQGELLAEHFVPPGDDYDPHRYLFIKCVGCDSVMVGYSEYFDTGPSTGFWTQPIRHWPEPEEHLHINIPWEVRYSLKEAEKCYKSKAYMASAVMSGRALEEICYEKTGAKTLAKGLEKMKNAKIIDEKLYEWGEALRSERNIGAHAGKGNISAQNASDVLDFAIAIAEYIYVFDARYMAYKKRKGVGKENN
jgi:hypothetical protein